MVKATMVGLGIRTGRAIATSLLAETLGLAFYLPIYLIFRSWGWA